MEKVPEVPGTEETKKLRPKVPLEDRLKSLLTFDRVDQLISLHRILIIYGVMSFCSFIAIIRDKRLARRRQWRVSERTLHLLDLLGGWPGGLVAQQIFRHKTRKVSYQVTFWIIVAIHGLGWTDYLLHHKISRSAWALIQPVL